MRIGLLDIDCHAGKKKRGAKVVSISELTEFIEDGGRFQRKDEVP